MGIIKQSSMNGRCFFQQSIVSPSTFLLLLFISVSQFIHGQESLINEESHDIVSHAFDLYENNLFEAAEMEFKSILNSENALRLSDPLLLTKVKLYKTLCDVKLRKQDSEYELLSFINNNQPSAYDNIAYIELADYYYNDQDFKRALEYFSEINLNDLSNEKYSEIIFKKAYSHFVRKEFGVTKELLKKILHLQDQYYYAANYYNGLAEYFTEEYDAAVASFKKLKNANEYKHRIPYYIAQIYFQEEQYDELVDYAIEVINVPETKNVKEIRGLLGQVYFIKKEYEKAIFHLAHYVNNTKKLRAEDFYQLGFAYYQTKQYSNAIDQFTEIANEKSKLGQNANNYLANSYLNTNNKNAARTAFKRTSEMSFIPDLSEEALFNYGKLSSEMGYDREALKTLKKIESNSIYFAESQEILAHLLQNTEDYAEALRFIDGLEMQSPLMQESYQRIAYNYAMQFLVDGNKNEARINFYKSEKRPLNDYITALTQFRLADLDNQSNEYNQSINRLNKYFSLLKTGISPPADASPAFANYIQGYNYLKINDFTTARKYFEEAANDFDNNTNQRKLEMDALLRAADCYFRINAYQDAIGFYNKAINLRANGTDYAIYQRGILQGLLGKPYEKIVSMDEIINKYPNSPLADFALYQNGETLQAIGEGSEAENSFKKLIDDYKNSTLVNKALLKLGIIAFNQGNLKTAIKYYKELFDHNPNAKESQEAMLALEEIYVDNLAKPDEYFDFIEEKAGFAMSDFEKDSISFRSGDIPYENGEYEKAIQSYSNYLNRYPKGFNRLVAHYRRAESYLVQKQYAKALNDYDYVVHQDFSEYYLPALEKSAIISYNSLEDYKKAFDYYSLLEELTDDPDKRYKAQMGALRSAARINEFAGMEYMANRILANDQIGLDDKVIATFYLSKVHFENQAYEKAIPLLNEVRENSDNVFTAEARYILSKIYYDQKNYDQSKTVIQNSIEKSKPYPFWVAKSLILLSEIFIAEEDLLQAKAALEAVVENFSADEALNNQAKEKLNQVLLMEEEQNRIEQDSTGADLKMETGNDK